MLMAFFNRYEDGPSQGSRRSTKLGEVNRFICLAQEIPQAVMFHVSAKWRGDGSSQHHLFLWNKTSVGVPWERECPKFEKCWPKLLLSLNFSIFIFIPTHTPPNIYIRLLHLRSKLCAFNNYIQNLNAQRNWNINNFRVFTMRSKQKSSS